jgi:hypothetical protein
LVGGGENGGQTGINDFLLKISWTPLALREFSKKLLHSKLGKNCWVLVLSFCCYNDQQKTKKRSLSWFLAH